MIIHIDCNSFYASCETAFRPDLRGKPVVVANCNEAGGGIILALSKEAKAIGLKRGNPVFQVKDVLEKNNVAVFPSNLLKYCDMSQRIMSLVIEKGTVLDFIQYSVDEFFGTVPTEDPEEVKLLLHNLKNDIEKGIGVPVSCGASSTYTLAKVATWFAKHYPAYEGVAVLPSEKRVAALEKLPIEEVWGIGRRIYKELQYYDVKTAFDFTQKKESFIRSKFTVTGVRTWKELQGTPCIDITSLPLQRNIMHSRTFTFMTSDFQTLRTYMSNYAAAASRKLRDQHSVCQSVGVFIATNPHRDDLEQYGNSASMRLVAPTSDTVTILKKAAELLQLIFREGLQYKRAGIILSDITADNAVQLDMFSNVEPQKSRSLMNATDNINTRYGMNKVRLASQGFEEKTPNLNGFQPLKNQTTNIDDIIVIKK